MNPKLLACLEKGIVWLLALSFALPLTLGLWLWLSQNHSFATVWFRNATLHGMQIKPKEVPASRASLLSAEFQTAYATNYDARFAGRELLIRVINEIYLRAFQTTHSTVIVGPHLSLIERTYVEEYCLQRGSKDALRPLADDLRRLQGFCEARGIAFALMITPSKAAVYPESLPVDWLRRYRHEPRYYDNFVSLLREKGVRYVDGHRIAVEMKPAFRVPVFPQGGVHWGNLAALATTNAMLELLAGQGLGVQKIENYHQVVSNRPTGQERDLADLLNTLFLWHYPVSIVTVQPVAAVQNYRPNMVVIGGSFMWSMLAMLNASQQFSELEYYRYYKLSKHCGSNGQMHLIAEPTPPVNFETDVFAADSLVLEANEQTLHQPNHLIAFLHDALAVLPDPHSAKSPFHYESQLQYAWGETLSFASGQNPINIAVTQGFASPREEGSFTVGTLAAIHFRAPPPTQDMILEINAGAFLVDTRLVEQRVAVFINGHPVGECLWKESHPSRRELAISKEFLSSGEVTLEFRIARPGSPSEFGLGVDSRKLGLLFTSIRLHEVGK